MMGRVVDGPFERRLYGQDQAEVPDSVTRLLIRAVPDLVVQPTTVEEVEAVLRYAREKHLPVVPRAAGSSPYGGSVPARGGLVVDLSLMRQIVTFDEAQRFVVVQTGVRWADLDYFLRHRGFTVLSHPTSWFSTVGGWLQTGGLGMHSVRAGPFADQVLWIDVVDFSGRRRVVVSDPEFRHYVGSEGQLGLVAALAVHVRPVPAGHFPHLLTFTSTADAFAFVGALFEKALVPSHLGYYDPARLHELNRLKEKPGLAAVLPEKDSLLLEWEDEAEVEAFRATASQNGGHLEERYKAAFLWEHRFFPMAVRKFGPGLLGAEILMPLEGCSDAIAAGQSIAHRFRTEVAAEVQVANAREGVLIFSYLTDPRDEAGYFAAMLLSLALTAAGIERGGRPYGLGLWNQPFLRWRYDGATLHALRAHKQRADPEDLLNPGKSLSRRPVMAYHVPPLLMRALPSPRLARLAAAVLGGLRGAPPKVPAADAEPLRKALRAAYECARCGACITVCPAYVADRTEIVTARGKLVALRALLAGEELPKEQAHKLFDCIHCGACTNVCQSQIDLVPIWDLLEGLVEEKYGKPAKQIADFTRRVEASDEFWDLVAKGLAYPLQVRRER